MRRHITSLLLLVVLGSIFLAEYTDVLPTTIQAPIVTNLSKSKGYLESVISKFNPDSFINNSNATSTTQKEATTSTDQQTNSADQTPAFSMVNKFVIGKTYYYHFTDKTPKVARQAFNDAIYAYNQTGVVNLVEGNKQASANSITFSIYYKDEGDNAKTLELGTGGPQLTYRTNDSTKQAINHATAKINMTYPESVSDSVTMHELGHALGLNHSNDATSIMYPTNQGVTSLSDADIAGLKAIYDK
ncbi:matrixin family metalloprotease [Companilactobacillus allii]|uniref:Peptidase metallopeptidase domain-containing protein n=1 Tax=Companilactobacillus allii TaxID=1847728 RepID=A0A1P8Q1P7_9LACO|nr:matrixin family metalloprotease [Companilactobacillus allii]APX71755.1 hypothetical protein BTM29_03925 [Companilactobacillus allii]USQ68842.1 matrixin family metalloprotease [Companilactobacillus allii]